MENDKNRLFNIINLVWLLCRGLHFLFRLKYHGHQGLKCTHKRAQEYSWALIGWAYNISTLMKGEVQDNLSHDCLEFRDLARYTYYSKAGPITKEVELFWQSNCQPQNFSVAIMLNLYYLLGHQFLVWQGDCEYFQFKRVVQQLSMMLNLR